MKVQLAPGTRVGEYVIEEVLGHGSMGTVFRARQGSLDRDVALKVIPVQDDGILDELRRFRRGGNLQAQLHHPGLVRIHELGRDGALHYIAMELVEGVSLGERLRREGPMAPATALELLIPVAESLAYLHSCDVRHRDLKPDNILLDPGGMPRLTDFGLARTSNDTTVTRAHGLVGTLRYLAPELFQGGRWSVAADVYALAIVIHETMSGRMPFPEEGLEAWAKMKWEDPPTPLSRWVEVPVNLDHLLSRMLLVDPAKRPAAAEVHRELERVAGELVAAGTPAPAAPAPRPGHADVMDITTTTGSGPLSRWLLSYPRVLGMSAIASLGISLALSMRQGHVALPDVSFVTESRASPTAGGEREKLLARFRERLISVAPRFRVRPVDPASKGVVERFWLHWGRREANDPPGTAAAVFVAFEPGGAEELSLAFPGWNERGSQDLAVNGRKLDPAATALPRAALRVGLNRLTLEPVAGASPCGERTGLLLRRGRLRAVRPRDLSPPEPDAVLEQLPDIESALWSGHWRQGEQMARDLRNRFPESVGMTCLLARGRLLFVRAARDFTHGSSAGIDSPHGFVADMMRDPESALVDLAEAMDLLQDRLARYPGESRSWRAMGELLCAGDEVEMGWKCLTYACLLEPGKPANWYAFFSVYDLEYLVHPTLEAHRPEIRECLVVARELCTSPGEERLLADVEKALVRMKEPRPAGG